MSELLYKMLNTAAAIHLSVTTCFGPFSMDVLEAFRTDKTWYLELLALRHPDFQLVAEQKIMNTDVQIRGSWQRLYPKPRLRPQSRAGHSSWIWNSRLYIYGGRIHRKHNAEPKELIDFWYFDYLLLRHLLIGRDRYLDLRTLNSWKRLQSPPNGKAGDFADTKICIWDDNAWLFFGHLNILKFDLKKETWKYIETKRSFPEPWPYNVSIREYCAEVFEGVLYVFGGLLNSKSPGTNLHMALDLRTRLWTKLGGTGDPKVLTKGMPPLRYSAASWVAKEERRMFILYGSAVPSVFPGLKESSEFQHDDMWSYSFDERVWRLERIRGGFPSPRIKMACVYHEKLQHVIVFGGVNVRVPVDDARHSKKLLCYAPLGDTFVLDLKTRIWKQVVTTSLPHHRFFAQANVDESTGKIYLFGGECSMCAVLFCT